jgi:hypothetical protein
LYFKNGPTKHAVESSVEHVQGLKGVIIKVTQVYKGLVNSAMIGSSIGGDDTGKDPRILKALRDALESINAAESPEEKMKVFEEKLENLGLNAQEFALDPQ